MKWNVLQLIDCSPLHSMEDALNTARAAIEEGTVPGGGIALLNLYPRICQFADCLEADQKPGALAVAEALRAPARQILENAGLDGEYLVEVLLEKEPGTGYDVDQHAFVNMIDARILDPVKVTRLAFENAVSVASTIATAEAIVYKEETQPKTAVSE